MRVTSLSFELEKRTSDGDYGGEKAAVQVAASLEAAEDPEMALRVLMDIAREAVESDLKRSTNLKVAARAGPRDALVLALRARAGRREKSYMHQACREARTPSARSARPARPEWAESNTNAERRAIRENRTKTASASSPAWRAAATTTTRGRAL